MSRTMHNEMLVVPVSSTVDMYEMMSCFMRKSYFNLKTHNIFLRCCFMANNLKKYSDLNDNYNI